MRTLHIGIIGVCALWLAACGKPEPAPKAQDTVFGELVSTKDRAKQDTEKALQQSQQKLDEAMKKVEATTR
jgi:hypothetical protein